MNSDFTASSHLVRAPGMSMFPPSASFLVHTHSRASPSNAAHSRSDADSTDGEDKGRSDARAVWTSTLENAGRERTQRRKPRTIPSSSPPHAKFLRVGVFQLARLTFLLSGRCKPQSSAMNSKHDRIDPFSGLVRAGALAWRPRRFVRRASDGVLNAACPCRCLGNPILDTDGSYCPGPRCAAL